MEVRKPGVDFGKMSLERSLEIGARDRKLWTKKWSIILFLTESLSLWVVVKFRFLGPAC